MGVAVVAVAVAVVHRPPLFACGCSSAAPDPSSLCTCSAAPHRLVDALLPLSLTSGMYFPFLHIFNVGTPYRRTETRLSSSLLPGCSLAKCRRAVSATCSSSLLPGCSLAIRRVGYLFFLSSCWIQTSFPLISSVLYPPQCSRIAMMIHFIISILYVPQ